MLRLENSSDKWWDLQRLQQRERVGFGALMIQSLSMQITSSDSHDKQNTPRASKGAHRLMFPSGWYEKDWWDQKSTKHHHGNINRTRHWQPSVQVSFFYMMENLCTQGHGYSSKLKGLPHEIGDLCFLDISSSSSFSAFVKNGGCDAISDPLRAQHPLTCILHSFIRQLWQQNSLKPEIKLRNSWNKGWEEKIIKTLWKKMTTLLSKHRTTCNWFGMYYSPGSWSSDSSISIYYCATAPLRPRRLIAPRAGEVITWSLMSLWSTVKHCVCGVNWVCSRS